MTDIADRLRELARNYADGVAGMTPQDHFVWEAADEIERLRADMRDEINLAKERNVEIERLRVKVERLQAILKQVSK